MFQVENVNKTYRLQHGGVNALNHVSFTISPESFVTITGASGSGKTTLLLALGGLIHPSAGSIHFRGADLYTMPSAKLAEYRNRKVGFVLQTFNLVPYLNARQNVMLPMLFDVVGRVSARSKADTLLKQVGLDHRMEHMPRELSVGQQQRVAIARALANSPEVLLADEPTGNLDPNLAREILTLLKDLNAAEGRTIIMVTHSPDAAEFGTRCLHLRDGMIENN